MANEFQPESSENAARKELMERIARDDERYQIEELPLEDAAPVYLVRRSSGAIESWRLEGEGPVVSKLISRDERGLPMVKYLERQKLLDSQAALAFERETALRARAALDLGEEAAEAVPVIGPNSPLITEVPRFEKPTKAVVTTALDQPIVSSEKVQGSKYNYLRDVLPPLRAPMVEENSSNYDALIFGGDDQQEWVRQPSTGQPERVRNDQKKYYERFVTQENRDASLDFLQEVMKATPLIRDILDRYNLDPSSIESVDAIRESPEVRFEVAKVIAEKLDSILSGENDLGWRLNESSANNLKEDQITGKKLSSRTHAVSLALKMIGGEFSDKNVSSIDTIERDESGRVVQGQHRHAATSALMSYYANPQ